VSVLAFIVGSLFVLSNDADINANVIGASGEAATLTAFIGILTIIASAVFFILTINHGHTDIESMIRKDENKHEDMNKQHIIQNELEEKYELDRHKKY
jgi:hypothetical protein